MSPSKLTLGPLLFHWDAEKRRDFYFRIADEAPVDCVYLGEVVCSKRTPFFAPYREAVIERLQKAGKQVVLSSLALLTSPREVAGLKEDAAKGLWIEANDVAAIQVLMEKVEQSSSTVTPAKAGVQRPVSAGQESQMPRRRAALDSRFRGNDTGGNGTCGDSTGEGCSCGNDTGEGGACENDTKGECFRGKDTKGECFRGKDTGGNGTCGNDTGEGCSCGNDAVYADSGRPFVVGPTINVLNEGAMDALVGAGARRIVFASELNGKSLAILAALHPETEKEVQVFGRQSLAVSMRCYHARANGRDKDHCRMACGADPDGLEIETQTGQKILTVNGTQTLSHGYVALMAEMLALREQGITHFRLSPQDMDMVAVAHLYRDLLDGRITPESLRKGLESLRESASFINGFYHGREGLVYVAMQQ